MNTCLKLVLCGALVTFAPITFVYAEETHGILTVVKGDVNVQSGKDNATTKAKVGMKVFPRDTIIAGVDSRAKITMVDKNILNVSPDSKVVIESYEFKPEEDKKKVILNVIYGKVRSSVTQKYDGEKNSFQVKTPSAVAGVRGTDFMVQFNSVTNAAKIVTFTGQVEVGAQLDAMGKIVAPVLVNPGQFTVASQTAPPAAPAVMSAAELASVNAETSADKGGKSDTASKDSGSTERKPASDKQGDKSEKEQGSKDGAKEGGQDSKGGKDGGKDAAGNADAKGSKEGGGAQAKEGGDSSKGPKGPGPTAGSASGNGPKGPPLLGGPTGGMGPDSKDLTNDTTGAPPAFADTARGPAANLVPNIPVDPVCPTCGFNFTQPQIPDDILRGGDTKLIINVQTQ